MHEQENIALAKRGFEAAMAGDYDTLRSLLADDISFSGPFQPELHGIDEVIADMRQSDELGFSMQQHEYEGAWADDNRVVLLHHIKMSRDGRSVDTHTVQIVEVRGGKASKVTMYTAEPEKLSAVMS